MAMLEDFVFFPRLPPELRSRIWEFALQSISPGAHFFRVVNHSKVQETRYGILLSDWPKDHYLMPPRWSVSPFTAISSRDQPEPMLRLKGNPSSYVPNLNLRRACRESRYAVYRSEKRRSDCTIARPGKETTLMSTGRNAPYRLTYIGAELSETSHIMCAPEDLVIFQLHPLRSSVRSLRKGGSNAGLDRWGLEIRHIGWEYDTEWFSKRRTCPSTDILNFMCSWALRGVRDGRLEKLWIINYKIKRKQWVPSKSQAEAPPMHIFNMDKYRLVEIDHKNWRHLSEEEFTWQEVFDGSDEDASKDFLLFVNFLQGLIMLLIGRRQGPRQRHIPVGILACEGN